MNGLRVISGCSQHKAIDQAGSIHPVLSEANTLCDGAAVQLLCSRVEIPPTRACSFSSAPAEIRQRYAETHSLEQPKVRILDICECTLIITQQFLFT